MPEFPNVRTVLSCVALLLSAPAANAQYIDSAPDYSIKAAYLYNFAIYVEWPSAALGDADAGSSFVIGVLGDDRVADYLASMTATRQVHERPVEVRRVERGDPLDSLHMLFIGRSEADALPLLRAGAREHSVLVVSDWEGALESGSAINFRLIDRRIRFEVSLDVVEDCGLSISSRMLAVAERVLPRTGE